MRDIAILCETSLFVLSNTYLAWKMSDYAVHFGLSSTAQTKEKKLHAALDGAVEERGLATVRAFAIRYKSAPGPRYWLRHCWKLAYTDS